VPRALSLLQACPMARLHEGGWRVLPPDSSEFVPFLAPASEVARLRAILRLHAARTRIYLIGPYAPAAAAVGEFSWQPGNEAVRAAIENCRSQNVRKRYENLCTMVGIADTQAGLVVDGVWALPSRSVVTGKIVLIDGLSLATWLAGKRKQVEMEENTGTPGLSRAGVLAFEFGASDFTELINLMRVLIRKSAAFNVELEAAQKFVLRLRESLGHPL